MSAVRFKFCSFWPNFVKSRQSIRTCRTLVIWEVLLVRIGPMSSTQKENHAVTRFPRSLFFALLWVGLPLSVVSVLCDSLEWLLWFWLVHCIVFVLCDWLEWLLWVLIGSLYCLCPLWLARVILLVLLLRNAIEKPLWLDQTNLCYKINDENWRVKINNYTLLNEVQVPYI